MVAPLLAALTFARTKGEKLQLRGPVRVAELVARAFSLFGIGWRLLAMTCLMGEAARNGRIGSALSVVILWRADLTWPYSDCRPQKGGRVGGQRFQASVAMHFLVTYTSSRPQVHLARHVPVA